MLVLDPPKYPRKTKKAAQKVILGGRRLGNQEFRRIASIAGRQDQRSKFPKRTWGPGPWQDEPDFLAFTHAGLECFVIRNMQVSGALNGYVLVPPEHPWWGHGYSDCTANPQCEPEYYSDNKIPRYAGRPHWSCEHRPESLAQAHGGLTYGGPPFHPRLGQKHQWGFGFDTNHGWDYSPMMEATLKWVLHLSDPSGREWERHQEIFKDDPTAPDYLRQKYRDIAYVRQEVEELAEQLALIKAVEGP